MTCPTFCKFRLVCPESRQRGVNRLFVGGLLEHAADCFAFEGLTKTLRDKYMINLDGSAEDIHEQVLERQAIQGDD